MTNIFNFLIRVLIITVGFASVLMSAQLSAKEPDDEGWAKCADEGAMCSFSGKREVRYGANGKYVTRAFNNGVECSNNVFGDPVEGVSKQCDIAREGRAAWLWCAKEGEACKFRGVRTVRYGANGQYVTKEFNHGVECSNAVFGDPVEGVSKQCEIGPEIKIRWTRCANEGEICKFTGIRAVRYGARGSYAAPRDFSNGVDCGNAVFGDPIPGVSKQCEYGPEIPVTWTKCANEGSTCKFSGMRQVRYGARNKFAEARNFSGEVECGNATFGDPIPGVSKQCEYGPEIVATWTKCAREGESCSFVGTRQVRYGINGKFAIREINSTTGCNNQVFGDPVEGETKYCEYGPRIR
ncbi:MAG: hypothetical protein ABIP67_10580 [Burkholderiales bacterium]